VRDVFDLSASANLMAPSGPILKPELNENMKKTGLVTIEIKL
jgi:hypothetical protein